QLNEIISISHNYGLDWYFTKTPDLRCGIRPLNGQRAKRVFFRVWYLWQGQMDIHSDDFKLENNRMPLSKIDFNNLKKEISYFASEYIDDAHKEGLLPNDYDDLNVEQLSFDQAVSEAYQLPSEERLKKIKTITELPSFSMRKAKVFNRDPNIVAEALFQAKGSCNDCGAKAPFIRKSNGQPYLEVHHIVPLSEGGKDALDNVTALCPNCHRKRHHG
ncbi:HNH endonuclease, partial [Acetobacter fabarum]